MLLVAALIRPLRPLQWNGTKTAERWGRLVDRERVAVLPTRRGDRPSSEPFRPTHVCPISMPKPPSPPTIRPIVLIDDEQEVAVIMRGLLANTAFAGQFLVYHDAGSALKFLAQAALGAPASPERIPSLIFVDLQMPEVDGLSVIRWVRDHPHLETVKLAVLSASNSTDDRERAALAGADHYLVKYPNAKTLAALARWSALGGDLPTL